MVGNRRLSLIATLLLGALVAPAAAAQSAPDADAAGWNPTARGTMRLAGSGALSWETTKPRDTLSVLFPTPQTTHTTSLDLTLQYFVVRGLAVGITGSYGRTSIEEQGASGTSGTSRGLAAGPAITWFPNFGRGRLLPYVQLLGALGSSHDESHTANQMFTSSGSGHMSTYTASAGVILMLASHVGADVAVEYYSVREWGTLTIGGDFGLPQTEPYDYRHAGTRLRLGLAVFVQP